MSNTRKSEIAAPPSDRKYFLPCAENVPAIFMLSDGTCIDKRTAKAVPNQEEWCITTEPIPHKYTPGGHRKSKVLEELLVQWTGNNPSLMRYLRFLCAYALKGDNPQQAFFFLYGAPNTGKTLFAKTLKAMLGEQLTATLEPKTIICQRGGSGHPHHKALLEDKQVAFSEDIQGGEFEVSFIITATDGTKMAARKRWENMREMHVNPIIIMRGSTIPTWPRPALSNLTRRLVVVPFNHDIGEPDPDIWARIEADLPVMLEEISDFLAENWDEVTRFSIEQDAQVKRATREAREVGIDESDRKLIKEFVGEILRDITETNLALSKEKKLWFILLPAWNLMLGKSGIQGEYRAVAMEEMAKHGWNKRKAWKRGWYLVHDNYVEGTEKHEYILPNQSPH